MTTTAICGTAKCNETTVNNIITSNKIPNVIINSALVPKVLSVEFTQGVSKRFDKATVVIANSAGGSTTTYPIYGTFELEMNNTILFRGRVLSTKPTDKQKLEITAEDYSAILADRQVNKDYTNTSINSIITDVMGTYLPSITLTHVTSVATAITKKFQSMSVLEVLTYLADISHADGYDFYVDELQDLHFFQSSTVSSGLTIANTGGTKNLIQYDFPNDGSTIYNRVTVRGATLAPVVLPISATVNDTTSQATYGIKEMPDFVDPTILSADEATDKGNRLLTRFKNPNRVGVLTVKASAVETLTPGETITVNISGSGISSATYLTLEKTTKYPENKATVRVTEWYREIADMLAEMLKEIRRSSMRSIDTTSLTLMEEYSNHLGTTDNFMKILLNETNPTLGTGSATTDSTNHKILLSTGTADISRARYCTKKKWSLSDTPIIANFIVTDQRNGDGSNWVRTTVGLAASLTQVAIVDSRYFECDRTLNGFQWVAQSCDGFNQQYTNCTVNDGDLLTIVARSDRTDFYVNNTLVATHKTIVNSNPMEVGASVQQQGTPITVAQEISVDLISIKVFKKP